VIIVRALDEITERIPSVCTIGSYDGLHRAHREIVAEVVRRARESGRRSLVITFDPHPKEVVASARGPVELLTTIEERIELFRTMEVDLLYAIPFTYEFSRLTSREFYKRYIVDGLDAREVVVGYDHMFGRDRESGINDVVNLGTEFGFSVHTVPPFYVGTEIVSSTKIRKLIKAGNVADAARFLGREYSFEGTVVRGDGRGGTIGYPTANIIPTHPKKLIPGIGVYCVTGNPDGRMLRGMMNIGRRPTFAGSGGTVNEVHFFGTVGELYGTTLTITFHRKIRDEKKFSSVEELITALEKDKRHCLTGTSTNIQ
jgi:riboflavin kinase / FMN adenylyltransferase